MGENEMLDISLYLLLLLHSEVQSCLSAWLWRWYSMWWEERNKDAWEEEELTCTCLSLMTFFFMPVSIRVKVRLLGFQDSQNFLTKFVPISQQKYLRELVIFSKLCLCMCVCMYCMLVNGRLLMKQRHLTDPHPRYHVNCSSYILKSLQTRKE